MLTKRLVLFAKRPRASRVKTRLVPPLDPEHALRIYRAFLIDQLDFLRRLGSEAQVEWCADGALTEDERAGLGVGQLELTLQGTGNLGERLLGAFQRARSEGSRSTVIIGADSPTLPATHVRQAFRELERGAPAVLSPAADGGYVLIGLRDPLPELFRDVAWGDRTVSDTTRARAAGMGLELVELDSWYDVDDIAGLRRLSIDLDDSAAARRAPATRRCLLDRELPPVV